MYDFIDAYETPKGASLPSEALRLNGEYIENQISGYRTLHVTGRESLSPELICYETGVRDGSKLQSRRYPERMITVAYQLVADTNTAFREAYNKLGAILDVVDAELIFNDEVDKFFVGSLNAIGAVEPGKNAVVGEFELLCTDPFKYSVVEYAAEPSSDDGTLLIDYGGTYRAFPLLEAAFFCEEDMEEDDAKTKALTGAGDCGFVAFLNEKEKIIQLGNPNEEDDKTYAKSQTLVNQTFTRSTSWSDAAKDLWAASGGSTLPSSMQQTGSVGMGGASFTIPAGTSATILSNAKSKSGAPIFNYTVTAKAQGRTEKTTKVSVSVTTSLTSGDSYFGNGFSLKGSVFLGGSWRDVVLKKTSAYWEGKTGHTVSGTFVVEGLTANITSLTGIKFKVSRTDSQGGSSGNIGETTCKNLPISPYATSVPVTYYLTALSYGSASGKYHGPVITRTLPADGAAETGAGNFIFTYKQKMCISSAGTKELGAFQLQVCKVDGKSVAGVRILKNRVGKSASLVFYVNGKAVYTGAIDLSYGNKCFGANESSVNTSTITKVGSKITFSVGGVKKTFTDSGIATTKAHKIAVAFEQYSTSPVLAYNGLYWIKFVKNNCTTYKDIPNKFSANDRVVADCRNCEILVNGVSTPELGALGNDWENFCLVPGINQIGTAYSDWVKSAYAPTFKVRYREVFL